MHSQLDNRKGFRCCSNIMPRLGICMSRFLLLPILVSSSAVYHQEYDQAEISIGMMRRSLTGVSKTVYQKPRETSAAVEDFKEIVFFHVEKLLSLIPSDGPVRTIWEGEARLLIDFLNRDDKVTPRNYGIFENAVQNRITRLETLAKATFLKSCPTFGQSYPLAPDTRTILECH
jgi:hypothetical protein